MDKPPQHVAIICDGNRRWARAKGLPEDTGHKYSAEHVFFELVEKAARMSIPYITFWVLSTENERKRSEREMAILFQLMKLHFSKDVSKLQEKDVKLTFIGNIEELPNDLRKIITKVEEESKDNKAITVILALNYGGRDEIIRAVNTHTSKEKVTEADFDSALDTAGTPDPDIIIRTGGEHRLSGFLPWQSVYSELFFTDTLFPDFKDSELEKIVTEFSSRERRFGK
ncbi:di-trans,poly-cis-decaprenylcistransferase [Candidatus Roizmanbacteria bacterium RIFCSPHIGHO2_02_FULL_40_13b]|uniref:Isoprenyl transferase n=1 Tax=Candidatus Roizmanbacteria bacterium RIFCSPHIGHO2_01_FULL_39_24 TaxID=1802032 RepID=A0A1F7GKH8_9BACT|nr:MAG: di-trans,poly-cis-decaprenylcistransferase [Candidatus Roizmanbacteria bacterium RIFCSPHIGHO2_01_FULL_39_24]OGK27434.1 MAG: di-trans,poly-cis-decaprenylcistransferase [Candidatus Roizmanbacteria bacterium RIFCSPHIGHO2_02_FULL_40_13b]OGK50421.1 MAG: di-trans,poly-cis-decaprenylcistransferase [Candidatus Roizmanbacteria bacterium RIFCSPLOWO2_01_FULL_40_32]